mgnify:CR=1 FL=1
MPGWLARISARVRGQSAEREALRLLQKAGLSLLARNYAAAGGEIDLIMRDGEMLVFVEVRFRGHAEFGSGAESVDRHKQLRIQKAARAWLSAHPRLARLPARFDIVSAGPDEPVWHRHAFEGSAW